MTRRVFFRALLGWLVVAETVRQAASVLGPMLRPEQPQTLETVETETSGGTTLWRHPGGDWIAVTTR